MKWNKNKVYRIVDEDGSSYEVEEIKDDDLIENDIQGDDLIENQSSGLTDDEILALKKLAGVADKLIGLLNIEEKEFEVVSDEDDLDEEKSLDDEDDLDEEKLIDTDRESDRLKRDAKTSFGSLRKISNKDSINDSLTNDIEDAWRKRYNG